MKPILAASVFLLACGCGDAKKPDRLIGTVWRVDSTTAQCATGLSFRADGKYRSYELCELNDGSYGAEAEEGWYEARDGILSFEPVYSTCADASAEPFDTAYSFNGSQLILSGANAVTTFEPNPPGGSGSLSVANGCFDSDGKFTPMPLHEI